MGHPEEHSERFRLARAAEGWAADRLAGQGWELLRCNLRTPYGEIDLLAFDAERVLVAVEVKARHPLSWAQDEEALRPRQRRRLARALSWVARQMQHTGDRRIDLLCVRWLGGTATGCAHYPDVEA